MVILLVIGGWWLVVGVSGWLFQPSTNHQPPITDRYSCEAAAG
jgi:hypothetical protein